MSKLLGVYKCNTCGNVVEVFSEGEGTLVCCGQEMELLEEKTEDEGKEKHVPVITLEKDKVIVKVGKVPHSMEEKHYINWVEVSFGDVVFRKQLKPYDKPEAEFPAVSDKLEVRIYCNLHGLWKNSL